MGCTNGTLASSSHGQELIQHRLGGFSGALVKRKVRRMNSVEATKAQVQAYYDRPVGSSIIDQRTAIQYRISSLQLDLTSSSSTSLQLDLTSSSSTW